MGKLARAKREALGDKYIGKHGTRNAPARTKKARIERWTSKAPASRKQK
jgi:hypothetical protein